MNDEKSPIKGSRATSKSPRPRDETLPAARAMEETERRPVLNETTSREAAPQPAAKQARSTQPPVSREEPMTLSSVITAWTANQMLPGIAFGFAATFPAFLLPTLVRNLGAAGGASIVIGWSVIVMTTAVLTLPYIANRFEENQKHSTSPIVQYFPCLYFYGLGAVGPFFGLVGALLLMLLLHIL